MSFAVDVNILLYASDSQSSFHAQADEFLREKSAGDELMYFAWVTIMSYLRMATHPSIFVAPLTAEQANQNVENLLRLPQVRVLSESETFWEHYRKATTGLAARGNLVPDAHLGAILLQHDVKILYTNDTDFKKFGFLEVRNPFAMPES